VRHLAVQRHLPDLHAIVIHVLDMQHPDLESSMAKPHPSAVAGCAV
jgi:hypothetical protein